MSENTVLDQLRHNSIADYIRRNAAQWCRLEPDEYGKKGKYVQWCDENEKTPFPCSVDQMEEYLIFVFQSGVAFSYLKHAKLAIDLEPPGKDPRIEILMNGIVRTKVQKGEATINQKDAMTIDHRNNGR